MVFKKDDIVQLTYTDGNKWTYRVLEKVGELDYNVLCIDCPSQEWKGRTLQENFNPIKRPKLLNRSIGHKLTKIFA